MQRCGLCGSSVLVHGDCVVCTPLARRHGPAAGHETAPRASERTAGAPASFPSPVTAWTDLMSRWMDAWWPAPAPAATAATRSSAAAPVAPTPAALHPHSPAPPAAAGPPAAAPPTTPEPSGSAADAPATPEIAIPAPRLDVAVPARATQLSTRTVMTPRSLVTWYDVLPPPWSPPPERVGGRGTGQVPVLAEARAGQR